MEAAVAGQGPDAGLPEGQDRAQAVLPAAPLVGSGRQAGRRHPTEPLIPAGAGPSPVRATPLLVIGEATLVW